MKLLGEVFIVALYAIGLFSSITKAGFACLSNPCIHGICIDDLNRYVSSSYTCYCIDGYTGIQCQTNWDECWSNPCMNGGTCIDGVASYNCTCPDGYMGEQCEENFDECESNPCLNNGTCVDEVNGYVCQCLPGYSGVMCEIDEEVCNTTAETNCYNGGLCIEGPGISFSCICSPGWSGTFCELPVDECASTPCQNGAVCVDLKADYACACLFGFTGKNCEVKLVRCEDNPCENDALCLIESGGAVCYCVPDFHGNKCQYQYDECQLGPRCLNGGTCLDGIDNFTCSCPPNLTGRICECLIISPGHLNCSFILPSTSEFPTQTATVASTEYLTSAFSSDRTVPKSTTLAEGKVSRTTAPTFTETVLPSSSTFSFMAGTSSTHPPTEPISSYFTSSSETVVPDTELSTTTAKQMFTDVTVYQEKSSKITPQTESSTLTSTEMLGTNITTEKLKPVSVQTLTVPSYTEMVSEITTLPSVEEKSTLIPPDYYTTGPFTTEKVTLPPPSGETDETKSISLTSVGVETFSDGIFTVLQTVKTTAPTSDISALDTTELEYTTATQVIPSAETEVYTSTAKIPDCSVTPCLHGGTCTYFEGGSQCKCKSEWTGPLCEVYTGNDTVSFREHSFVTHHLIEKTGAKIEVQARTLVLSGILLHAQLTSNVYMAVYIEDGLLNFQFSCGVQTMLFTEVRSLVNNGYDLKVQAMLELLPYSIVPQHCNAYLRINDSLAMSGEQIAATSQIGKTVNVLYLGGFPAEFSDLSEVQMKTGFVGCMHGLMVDNMPRHILHDSLSASGISECASLACLSNPCYDGGTCVEHNDEWNCLCPSGYVGKACEKSVCEVNPCQFGATCVIFPGSGFLCLCPLGKHGIFCEHDLDIGQPSFSPSVSGFSSYTAYPLPGTIHHNMELRFRFKPSSMEQIALMIFVGQDGSHDAQSDHLSVSFIKGYVVLTWNLGSGPRRIFTPRPVTQRARRPHFVSLGRSGKHAWLRVDNLKNVTGTSPGHMTQLNTHSPLYIGGHESANFSLLPHDLPLHSGFSGCLFDVELRTGRISVPLQKTRTATGRSVGQCGTTECHEHACQNGGACLHHGASFVCLCADGWFGPVCAQQYNPCDSSQHKCSSGATCVPLINGYECDCPFGKVGTYCERNETPSDVHFSGRRSFISLPIKNLHENEICIELEIRPLADRGLVLFIGQPDTNSFMSLSLQGGVLELRILPGQSRKRSETIVIRSGRVLAPREWHQVLAWRYGRKLYLRVDGSLSTGTMHAGERLPALGKILYLEKLTTPKDKFTKLKSLQVCTKTAEFRCYRGLTLMAGKKLLSSTLLSCSIAPLFPSSLTLQLDTKCQTHMYRTEVTFLAGRNFHISPWLLHSSTVDRSGPVDLILLSGGIRSRETWLSHTSNSFISNAHYVKATGAPPTISVIKHCHGHVCLTGIKSSRKDEKVWKISNMIAVLRPALQTKTFRDVLLIDFLQEQCKINAVYYCTGDLSNLPNAAMATLPEPFTGCIRRVYLNWEKIPLDEKNMIAARNIADCDGTPCGGDICEHGGTCWLDPYSQPRCSCKKFYTGAFCESQLTCTENSCQNNGRCMNRTSAIAECSCPLGWGGATCEEAVMTISPHFGGNGYLVVEGSGKSAKQNELSVQTKMEIGYLYINFSTIESKGMILWSSMGQEYLGIGIEEGLLKFAWGHPTTNRTLLLVSGGVAADGTWHTLEIDLSPRNITVWFDNQLIHSETEEGEGSKKFLITDGIFYLGGFPGEESVTELSNGLFSSHFIGCIKELAWNKNTSVTDFSDYQGENVGSCASIQT
ncbi:protein eyes shut-like [Schistocerca nitens]|uniref:protein eyes shut-like n=1 Tax=Schistocerca nitens TaxID=7011 RepID=UPI002117BED6|nr:protein eyes shut-like [Schistocerca nitens]